MITELKVLKQGELESLIREFMPNLKNSIKNINQTPRKGSDLLSTQIHRTAVYVLNQLTLRIKSFDSQASDMNVVKTYKPFFSHAAHYYCQENNLKRMPLELINATCKNILNSFDHLVSALAPLITNMPPEQRESCMADIIKTSLSRAWDYPIKRPTQDPSPLQVLYSQTMATQTVTRIGLTLSNKGIVISDKLFQDLSEFYAAIALEHYNEYEYSDPLLEQEDYQHNKTIDLFLELFEYKKDNFKDLDSDEFEQECLNLFFLCLEEVAPKAVVEWEKKRTSKLPLNFDKFKRMLHRKIFHDSLSWLLHEIINVEGDLDWAKQIALLFRKHYLNLEDENEEIRLVDIVPVLNYLSRMLSTDQELFAILEEIRFKSKGLVPLGEHHDLRDKLYQLVLMAFNLYDKYDLERTTWVADILKCANKDYVSTTVKALRNLERTALASLEYQLGVDEDLDTRHNQLLSILSAVQLKKELFTPETSKEYLNLYSRHSTETLDKLKQLHVKADTAEADLKESKPR